VGVAFLLNILKANSPTEALSRAKPIFHGYQFSIINIDGFVKSSSGPLIVIPAKAGTQSFQAVMGSCLRRNDNIFDFLRFRQYSIELWWAGHRLAQRERLRCS
jgi:hypothetical protein